jgi:hypothetical protein
VRLRLEHDGLFVSATLKAVEPTRSFGTTKWGASRVLRGAAVVELGGLAACAALVLINGGVVGLIPGVAFPLLAYVLWVRILRPRMVATDDGVEIHNGRRTERVAWRDIVRCEAGYDGTVITCSDGRQVLAPYPQKSNLATWLGRTTKADRAAVYIADRARRARGEEDPRAARPEG